MSFTDKAKQVLSTVAPLLTKAALGPFAPLADAALAAVFGTPLGDHAAASAALEAATPEQLLALKKAENDFTVQMKTLDIAEEKLSFDDTASARRMAVDTKDTTPRNLAYMVLGGTAVAIGATLAGFTHVDSALAGTLIGYMISECKSIMQFYFGSSASSRAKDATISTMASAP
jgi:hypothetical protein